MKKLLSILAMALCFVACQNDGVENVSNNDLVDVVLTVDAPELGITRADEAASKVRNSAYGAIDLMTEADWANFDLRYILEVYAEDDTNGANGMIYSERLVNCLDSYAETTFTLRLVPGRTYKFVVFADFVREGNAELTEPAAKLAIEDLYYNTTDLRNISAITNATYEKGNWDAMNDNRDAYFVSKNVEVKTNLNERLTLTRPFAKLRVITTDLSYIAGYAKPAYVEVTYHDTDVFNSFNAVSGDLNDTTMAGAELTYGFEVSKDEPYKNGYDYYATNQTLYVDYLYAKDEQTPVNFTMAVYEDAQKQKLIHSHDFNTQIPIERNHLTTIIGDLLTIQENIIVDINDDFVENEEIVRGWGDDNVTITAWEAGKLQGDNYEFTVKGEGDNEFVVKVNSAAVVNNKLSVGEYVLAEDAEEGATLTFTVENLQANQTTRALVDVKVIGGIMKVEAIDETYKITLDLVLQFVELEDVRHAIYEYEGAIKFGETLASPTVTAVAEGNTVTVSWTAVDGATSYFVAMGDAEAEETQALSKVYTDLAWNTEYTFKVYAKNDALTSVTVSATAKTELEPLATPVVKEPVVDGKIINLEWDAIEGAAAYSITVGTEMPAIVDEPKYKYDALEYNTEYTFTIVAIPADETARAASEAVTVTVKSGEEETVEPEEPTISGVVYLAPTGNWQEASAWFAAYFFNDDKGINISTKMIDSDWDGVYETTIPEGGYTHVIFVRMNPAATEFNWDNRWAQTENLELPADDKNTFVMTGTEWETTGEWRTKPATSWYIAGTFDGYNWNPTGIELVKNTDGLYETTATFKSSYEFKVVRNGNTWLGTSESTAFELDTSIAIGTGGNNVLVNAETGVEYKFSLNTTDKTITISKVVTEPEPTTPTIAEVLKSEDDAAVKTAGTVMAICTKGYILSDGAATIYVYTASEPTVAVGNNITVSGTFANYYGTLQIATPVVEENDYSTLVPTYPTPVDLTSQADYDAYQTFGTDAPTNYPFVKIKGTLSSARYITVGTSKKQSMFNYSVNDYTAMNGLEVTTTAYIIGYHSTNGYYQLIETSVEAAPYISASNKSVNADVTEASIEVSSNVTWNVTCDAEWVTSYTQSGNSNGTIDIVMSANELTEARSATFIISAGDVKKTVTLTQNGKEDQTSEDVKLTTSELAFTKYNRTTFEASKQAVYEANGIKLTNNKGSYNNNLGDYNEPARFYQGTEIIIEAPGNISSIVFDCNTAKPITGLTNSFETGVTYTTEDNIVTVTLDGSSKTFTIASANAQFRLNKITVTYAE